MALVSGDVVLVRTKAVAQDHKIAEKWEQNPDVMISQMSNEPVFEILPKNAKDQEGIRILHQNMLYLIQSAQNNLQDTATKSLEKSVMALTKVNLLMNLHFTDV